MNRQKLAFAKYGIENDLLYFGKLKEE